MLEILNLMVDQCLGNLRENSHKVQLGVSAQQREENLEIEFFE